MKKLNKISGAIAIITIVGYILVVFTVAVVVASWAVGL